MCYITSGFQQREREEQRMHARVATFEGGDPEVARSTIDRISGDVDAQPPEGVPATGFLMLHDAENRKVLAITFFENEEDMRTGDAKLSSIDPPVPGALGRRVSVELFEVRAKIDR
jgi:hypothetical protein